MLKYILSFGLLITISTLSFAQRIPLVDGWKFHTGDKPEWISRTFDDHDWQAIRVLQCWEDQGFGTYDGFATYRLHLNIPSSLKDNAFFKDSLRFAVGSGDDGYALYLNGKMIGKNYRTDIQNGFLSECTGTIAANDAAVFWDQDNVLSVRIFDRGGLGGVYGDRGSFHLAMADKLEYVHFNTSAGFDYNNAGDISKTLHVTTYSSYRFAGKMQISVKDLKTGATVFQESRQATFNSAKPFTWKPAIPKLQHQSYAFTYTFTEDQSGKSAVKTENTPYLLTPAVSLKPRINGANVYGQSAGKSFLYKIPATGKQPLAFKADGLPKGLQLDAKTGIITGMVKQSGDYALTLRVSNSLGTAKKLFKIEIGDLTGLTPALGWNSWNAFGLTINDARVRASAKIIAEKLRGHGWMYVNIDDGWESAQRNANGEIATNEKFPDMKGLAGYVHSLGLKFGIYSSPGPRTCGGFLGSYQHEEQDAQSYGKWDIDYLKYDWCSYNEIVLASPTLDDHKKPYLLMHNALDKLNRDILFSFCQYGMAESWKWAGDIGGNSWRTTGDISDSWGSMSGIGFHQQASAPYSRPGHFNDPDMLVVGKVGWGDNQHDTRLTPDEQYTHISLWSMLASPLLIGCDLSKLDKFTLNLLTNDEVLAIDQDALGKSAIEKLNKDGYVVYVKELEDGGSAVGIFNLSDQYKTIKLNWKDVGVSKSRTVRDVWRQQQLSTTRDGISTDVPPHGVILYRLN